MKYKNIKQGILLTREQLGFLGDDNQGFHHMKAFDMFLSLAAIEPVRYENRNLSPYRLAWRMEGVSKCKCHFENLID